VVEPYDIPDDWARYRAVDYGYAAPHCCLWIARKPDGSLVAYRETYGAGMTGTVQAKQIAALSLGESYKASVGDPAMWASHREGLRFQSVADQYKQAGVKLTEAVNDCMSGWDLVHELLDWSEEVPPRLTIFTTCVNLIRTFPMLVRDPNRPEDVDTDGEDHAADTLRYGAVASTKRGKLGEAVAQRRDGGAAVEQHVGLRERIKANKARQAQREARYGGGWS